MAFRLGLDIGSTTAKAVILDAGNRIAASRVLPTGHDVQAVARQIRNETLTAAGATADVPCAATGYGRSLVEFASRTVTEITCHARGVFLLHPEARSLVDVGGQDAKAIRLGNRGQVNDFAMNDRCAAGTGSFLDVVARRFQRHVAKLSLLPDLTETPEISSTCVVFAESEVVGLIARGHAPDAVLLGVHRAIARRVAMLVRQIRLTAPVYFSGGVALNETLCRELSRALCMPILRSAQPQLTAAIGAALLAGEKPE